MRAGEKIYIFVTHQRKNKSVKLLLLFRESAKFKILQNANSEHTCQMASGLSCFM